MHTYESILGSYTFIYFSNIVLPLCLLISFINNWSRKVMASEVFLIEYIHKQNMKVYIMSIPKSAIYEVASKYYCIDETMMIVTKKVNKHYMSGLCKNDRRGL